MLNVCILMRFTHHFDVLSCEFSLRILREICWPQESKDTNQDRVHGRIRQNKCRYNATNVVTPKCINVRSVRLLYVNDIVNSAARFENMAFYIEFV
jgi:hypothetical protein